MISDYFTSTERIERTLCSSVGPFFDGFTSALAEANYSPHTIRLYVGAAGHFGCWADRRGIELASWDEDIIERFRRHLSRCKCRRNKGVFHNTVGAVELLVRHLREQGAVRTAEPVSARPVATAIAQQFADWMLRHRGLVQRTVDRYQCYLRPLVAELGEDPAKYSSERIQSFVIDMIGSRGRGETRETVTAIRAFLRFLVAQGRVRPGIEHCVPTVPQWRLSSLPRYLEPSDVTRVIGSCDLTTGHGLRDHAILLLLARLGLRAGDIVGMMLEDVDWRRGTLLVRGKSRRAVLLPLPQDVGDALLAYLVRGRPKSTCERMFLTVHAPTRPFASSASVSDIVRFALGRAGISNPPSRGAHLLRYSAATAMLRAGASLETIATVLRHESSDTAAYYAKVDVNMLKEVAQTWPGGASC